VTLTLEDCIRLFENKILSLKLQKDEAQRRGDIDILLQKQEEIENTEIILLKLKS